MVCVRGQFFLTCRQKGPRQASRIEAKPFRRAAPLTHAALTRRESLHPLSGIAAQPTRLVVTLADGRRIATPLAWYPRLRDADAATRGRFELMPMFVHWSELDEDLGIAGMLRGRPGA